jgi:tetratricopeptide (TPR) repeat protein
MEIIPEEKSRVLRKKVILGLLCLVAVAVVLVCFKAIHRNVRSSILQEIPLVPDLRDRNKTLREKLEEANRAVKKAVEDRDNMDKLGSKIGNLGMFYQANHFYHEATSCYRLSTELDRKNPRWRYLMASVQQERGENESVLQLLEETARIAPTYSPAMLKLADSYFKMGHEEGAKTYYQRRLSLTAGDPYALIGLARIAMRNSQFESAQAFLEKAIKSDPGFGDAHRLLADVHSHFGRNEEARQALDKAAQCLRFHPAADPWLDGLMDFCYDSEQILVLGSKALAQLDMETALKKLYPRALEVDPENPKVHLAMGTALFMIGEKMKARQSYEEAIRLNPKCDEAYFQLGVISQSEGKLKDAEALFLRALAFQSHNPNVYNNLGVVLLEQGILDRAIEYLEQAIELYPEHLNAVYNLGMALWASGRTREAVDRYRQVLQMKPDWGVAANSLAWILATDRNDQIRNGEEAVRWARVACEGTGARNPEYLDTLAAAYAEAGQFDYAGQTAQKCIELTDAGKDSAFREEVGLRLRLYQEHKPFRR